MLASGQNREGRNRAETGSAAPQGATATTGAVQSSSWLSRWSSSRTLYPLQVDGGWPCVQWGPKNACTPTPARCVGPTWLLLAHSRMRSNANGLSVYFGCRATQRRMLSRCQTELTTLG